ncbi:MAG: hypothetical protein ABIP75_01005 [Pyrinomonadaceae bacterium]
MVLIKFIDQQFAELHRRSIDLLMDLAAERLYWEPEPVGPSARAFSCGESLVRSARAVERTFGGLTANLWDDPFEWTLPETLRTPADVIEYFGEVEATRCRGFALFRDDGDLARAIALAPDEFKPLGELLLDTWARAAHWQGRAFAVHSLFAVTVPPHI